MKNLNTLSNLPTSAFKEITSTDLKQSETNNNDLTITDNGISEKDLMNTAEHAKTTIFPSNTDNPTIPNNPTGPALPVQNTKLGGVIGGKAITDLIDILLPSLCVWGISAIGYKIGKNKLQMTAKEKEVLAPVMQQYLDSINIDFNNPLYNLLFVLGSIYASKVIDILPDLEKVKTSKKEPGKVIDMNVPKTPDEIVLEIYKKRKKSKADASAYYAQHKNIFDNAPNVDEAMKYIKEIQNR